MKLKVVVIDLEMSPALKRWLLGGAAALIGTGATLAYAAPAHVWSNGDTLTAEHLNAAFGDLDARLAKLDGRVGAIESIAAQSRSAFLATRSDAQDVPHGNDTTLILGQEYFDDSDEYDPSTGVFKPKRDGFYEIGCSWEADVSASGTTFYLEAGISVDGNKVYAGAFGDSREAGRSVRTIAKLDAGSQVTCLAYQDSGATVRTSAQLDTRFEAIRL
ncbi:MAG TPA: hypothetical protein VFZ61_23395 [Polyangiales bacterium]